MSKTVRFCINCGREIGEAANCPNPDCGGLPNFYRDVPAPDHTRKANQKQIQRARASAARPERPTRPAEVPEIRKTVPAPALTVAVLRSVSPPNTEHPIRLGVMEVGARAPAKLVIDRPEISSKHAKIECRMGSDGRWEFKVTDTKSTNGTFVNGVRLAENQECTLRPGDRVRFAKYEFELRGPEKEEPRVTMEMQ